LTFYAVIDTNVVIAALLSKKADSATVKVIKAVMDGKIIPLIHDDILSEYEDVLRRDKFHLQPTTIQTILHAFRIFGVEVTPQKSGEIFPDPDDLIFYEVTLAKRKDNAYLVTGNQRHYPVRDFIVTPAQMISILE
jgi:putative PIN family toxin of toxin-antitoxin system